MGFTIIVATCNRPERLACCLNAMAKAIMASGEAHRIIVVDNGSRLSAASAVDAFRRGTAIPVGYLESEPRNKSRALNAGIAAAGTEWLAFTDDDTLPDPAWLTQASAYSRQSGCLIFGGRVIPGEPQRPLPVWLIPGRSGRLALIIGVFVRYDPFPQSGLLQASSPVPFGANIFVRRQIFARYGGYDESLWALCGKRALGVEDSEFGDRVKNAGEPMGYCREAVVIHPVHHDRCALRTHLKLAYYYGWREPLVFFSPNQPVIEMYRVRLIGTLGLRAVADLCRRDPAGALDSAVRMIMCFGGMVGRLSPAYRRRAAEWEKRRAAIGAPGAGKEQKEI